MTPVWLVTCRRTSCGVLRIMQCLERWVAGDADTLAPRADATRAFNDTLEGSFGGTVWVTGWQSWHLDESGLPNVGPFPYAEFCRQMSHPLWEEFETEGAASMGVGPRSAPFVSGAPAS